MEHTADVGVVACGNSLAEALCFAAKGMLSIMADTGDVSPAEQARVSVSSTDTEALVVDWLNELIYLYGVEGFLPREFQIAVDEAGTSIDALCLGERSAPRRRQLRTEVKAATYHGLEVSHNGQWRIRVVLDV